MDCAVFGCPAKFGDQNEDGAVSLFAFPASGPLRLGMEEFTRASYPGRIRKNLQFTMTTRICFHHFPKEAYNEVRAQNGKVIARILHPTAAAPHLYPQGYGADVDPLLKRTEVDEEDEDGTGEALVLPKSVVIQGEKRKAVTSENNHASNKRRKTAVQKPRVLQKDVVQAAMEAVDMPAKVYTAEEILAEIDSQNQTLTYGILMENFSSILDVVSPSWNYSALPATLRMVQWDPLQPALDDATFTTDNLPVPLPKTIIVDPTLTFRCWFGCTELVVKRTFGFSTLSKLANLVKIVKGMEILKLSEIPADYRKTPRKQSASKLVSVMKEKKPPAQTNGGGKSVTTRARAKNRDAAESVNKTESADS